MWNNNESSMQNEGGYMDTSNNHTMSTENKFSNLKRGQNCVPLMIAHLNRYGEELTVWGMPIRIITFVAIVHRIEPSSTKVVFEFRDETGSIKGIKWLEGDAISYESPVSVNKYARVHGVMRKNQGNENYVLISNIQPMEHLNELLAHLMEVTLVAMEGEKMINETAQSDQIFLQNSASLAQSTSMSENIVNIPGLNKSQLLVMSIIKNSDSENGANINDIKMKLPNLASKVDDILQFLSAEGHIYTTITDDYFKMI